MEYLKSEYFTYGLDNSLYCDKVPVKEIINKTGTPVYIYSKKFFEDRYKEFSQAFQSVKHKVFYSVKANFNLNVIKINNAAMQEDIIKIAFILIVFIKKYISHKIHKLDNLPKISPKDKVVAIYILDCFLIY